MTVSSPGPIEIMGTSNATCWDREFADSLLEESGFELLVPLYMMPLALAK
jgi:hypothetical protein